MTNIPTPHINANLDEISKTVLMPGDPLRAKYIADSYLKNVKCFNTVRNMLGFTGTYKGNEISIMGSGMGMPSIGIYSYELYNFYSVESIIRIGSAGAISDRVRVRDIVIGMGASTNSNFSSQYNIPGIFAPIADYELLSKAVMTAEEKNIKTVVGNILSSDIFYNSDEASNDRWKSMGILAVEMETAALYMNAAKAGKKALGIFTISDHLYTGESLSSEERQVSFTEMMEIALETAIS